MRARERRRGPSAALAEASGVDGVLRYSAACEGGEEGAPKVLRSLRRTHTRRVVAAAAAVVGAVF